MKKKFIFDKIKNEYYHKEHPSVRFDKDDFLEMTDDDIENFFKQKINDLNTELNVIRNKKKPIVSKSLSDEEIKRGFDEIRSILNFENYFKRKDHLSL